MTTQRQAATIDASAYGVRIRHAEFDGEWLYEASVREFPDLTEYAETFEGAYALMMDAITTAAGMLIEQGRAIPPPRVPEEDFSGRVTLRVPRSLHRALSERAEEEGVSLNTHLVSVLSASLGASDR